MTGVLIGIEQVDSKSGVLTLFGRDVTATRSVTFDVGAKPYTLVAFNLLPGQTATLYNVAQMGDNTVRESIFQYNGTKVELNYTQPVGLVALTGTYRLILNQPKGAAVIKAYPQEVVDKVVSPVQSDIINSMALKAGVPSPTLQILNKPYTVIAYGLPVGASVEVYNTYDGYDAHFGTITPSNTAAFLEWSGDYRFVSNVDCLLTLRPNYVEFRNPYITKGDPGTNGTNGIDGAGGGQIKRSFLNGDSITLLKGMPVCLVGGIVKRADTTTPQHNVIGIVDTDSVIPGNTGVMQVSGDMSQFVAGWNVSTTYAGGLVAGAHYFLSSSGLLSPTPPALSETGAWIVRIGTALNSTDLLIDIEPGIQL